jgi:hypothetical protein
MLSKYFIYSPLHQILSLVIPFLVIFYPLPHHAQLNLPHALPSSISSPTYSFTFMNGCPSSTITLQYSQLLSPRRAALRQTKIQQIVEKNISIFSGKSSLQSLTTPIFSYQLYHGETLVHSSTIHLSSPHHNAIGYLYSASHGTCQLFSYLPFNVTSDPSSLRPSLLFLINGDVYDKEIYINEQYYGKISSHFSPITHSEADTGTLKLNAAGGSLPILFDEPHTFQKLQDIKFCFVSNSSRVCTLWAFPETVSIPSGSALFIYHFQPLAPHNTQATNTRQHPPAHVSIAPTGATSFIFCQNCEENINDDLIENFFWDSVDAISVMSVFCRTVMICCFLLSGCLSYLYYSLLLSCLTQTSAAAANVKVVNDEDKLKNDSDEVKILMVSARQREKGKEELVEMKND